MLKFNFAETRESRIRKYLKEDLLLLLAVVLIAVVAFILIEKQIEENIERANKEITKLRREERRLRSIQKLIKSLEVKKDKLKEKLEIVSELDRRREVPKPMYFFLQKEYMKGIWLEELTLDSNYVKTVGNIWEVKQFPAFLKNVEENIGKVIFKEIKEVKVSKPLNIKYYTFKFKAESKDGLSR
ncbi:hypothetical protein [Thermovibrio sp.]